MDEWIKKMCYVYTMEFYSTIKKNEILPVAHACNLNYSGDRDLEDHSSKPSQANSSTRPSLEKNHHRKGLVEWLKV
jgi:hypothetical protein